MEHRGLTDFTLKSPDGSERCFVIAKLYARMMLCMKTTKAVIHEDLVPRGDYDYSWTSRYLV
jgi:hypothetical protein